MAKGTYRSSRRERRLKRGPIASVVWDTKDLEIIRVYVGFSAKETLRIFLSEIRNEYPPENDDSSGELLRALDRYKIEEIKGANVVIRRRIEEVVPYV